MGKSAKVHKRTKKLKTKPSTAVTPIASSSSIQLQVQAVKKKSLKQNLLKSNKGVLGGADYLTLLKGGRRKVEKEAKLLQANS